MKLIAYLLIVILSVNFISTSLIANINSAFEIFGPKSLIRFFEYNEVGWNISQECVRDLYSYLDGLKKDIQWSYKLLDSSGNYAGGFFYGQNIRPSNPEQCNELNDELTLFLNSPPDNSSKMHIVPFFVNLVNAKYSTYVNDKKRDITQTVCLPMTCSYEDLIQVLQYTSLAPDSKLMKFTELVQIRILYQHYKFYGDFNFIVLLALTSVMFFLIFGISLYGFYFKSKMRNLRKEKFGRNIACRSEVNLFDKEKKHEKRSSSADVINDKSKNKVMNFQMKGDTDSLTISSKTCNHLNLVKLQKNKSENTITLDIISTNCNAYKRKMKSSQAERKSVQSKAIFKFSLQHQLAVSTPSDSPHATTIDNKSIHGIRIFSLIWILLLNTTSVLSYVTNNTKYLEAKETDLFFHIMFKLGSFSFDSHFFINGFLLSQLFLNSSRDLNISNVSRISDHFKHFILLVFYKVFRILLPYVIVIHSLQLAMKHFQENSILSIPSNDHSTCDKIWKNLLFMNNFGPYEQRCALWTWFISLEMQFHVVALIVLMLSKYSKKFAWIIFIAFFTSTFFTSTAMDIKYKMTQISNFTDEEKLMFVNGIYDHPLVHVGPYLVGIFYGYFTFNYDKQIRVRPMFLTIGWSASVSLFALLMISSYGMSNVEPWVKHGFETISHSFWSLILLWFCFSSMPSFGEFVSTFLSSKSIQVISKTTNSILLIHPLITRIFILSSNNAIHMSVQLIIVSFFGFATITIIFGLLFYVIFEAPVFTLLNILYERLVEKSKSNNPC